MKRFANKHISSEGNFLLLSSIMPPYYMSSLLPLLLELMGLLKLQDTSRSQLKLTLRVDFNIGKGWEAKIEGPRYLSEIIATTGDSALFSHACNFRYL